MKHYEMRRIARAGTSPHTHAFRPGDIFTLCRKHNASTLDPKDYGGEPSCPRCAKTLDRMLTYEKDGHANAKSAKARRSRGYRFYGAWIDEESHSILKTLAATHGLTATRTLILAGRFALSRSDAFGQFAKQGQAEPEPEPAEPEPAPSPPPTRGIRKGWDGW
jgi:hypothetical protein